MIVTVDSTTLENFKKGERKAFNQVFYFFSKPIYYFCRNLVGNKEDAEDLTLQTFTKLFTLHDRFDTQANIKAFLYITARNSCFDHLKMLKRQQERQRRFEEEQKYIDELQHFEEELQKEDYFQYEVIKGGLLHAIEHQLNTLPKKYQEIFKMLFFEKKEPAEIAQCLNITVNNVYQLKNRAIKKLRIALTGTAHFLLFVIIILLNWVLGRFTWL